MIYLRVYAHLLSALVVIVHGNMKGYDKALLKAMLKRCHHFVQDCQLSNTDLQNIQ